MGVKRPPNGGRRNIGLFPSLKSGKSEWYESLLERDMLYLLAIDPGVISFRTRPFKITFLINDEPFWHIPDILAVRENKKQVIEVKPEEKTLTEDFILRTKCVSSVCRQHGYEYCVATEKFIRVEPRLSNVKLLFKYSRTEISERSQAALYNFFAQKEEVELQEVEALFKSSGKARQLTYALLYWGLLSVDINQNISQNVMVRLSSGNIHNKG
jgi:hypothetical protein